MISASLRMPCFGGHGCRGQAQPGQGSDVSLQEIDIQLRERITDRRVGGEERIPILEQHRAEERLAKGVGPHLEHLFGRQSRVADMAVDPVVEPGVHRTGQQVVGAAEDPAQPVEEVSAVFRQALEQRDAVWGIGENVSIERENRVADQPEQHVRRTRCLDGDERDGRDGRAGGQSRVDQRLVG